jgi:hypothetical protein
MVVWIEGRAADQPNIDVSLYRNLIYRLKGTTRALSFYSYSYGVKGTTQPFLAQPDNVSLHDNSSCNFWACQILYGTCKVNKVHKERPSVTAYLSVPNNLQKRQCNACVFNNSMYSGHHSTEFSTETELLFSTASTCSSCSINFLLNSLLHLSPSLSYAHTHTHTHCKCHRSSILLPTTWALNSASRIYTMHEDQQNWSAQIIEPTTNSIYSSHSLALTNHTRLCCIHLNGYCNYTIEGNRARTLSLCIGYMLYAIFSLPLPLGALHSSLSQSRRALVCKRAD